MSELKGYELSKAWFDYAFEHTGRIKPIHTAIYFYIVDRWNRLGKKDSFGLPTDVAMECLGISSHKTYIPALENIEEFGFIKIEYRAKNQYKSNIVALVKNTKASPKQVQSNYRSNILGNDQSNYVGVATIDKPLTKEYITLNNKEKDSVHGDVDGFNSLKLPGNHKTQIGMDFFDWPPSEHLEKNYKMFAEQHMVGARIPKAEIYASFDKEYTYTQFDSIRGFQTSFRTHVKKLITEKNGTATRTQTVHPAGNGSASIGTGNRKNFKSDGHTAGT